MREYLLNDLGRRALRLLLSGNACEDVDLPLMSMAPLVEQGLVEEVGRYRIPLSGGRVEIARELALTSAGRAIALSEPSKPNSDE